MDSTFQLLHSTLGDRMMASDFQGKFFSTWNCRCKWSLAWESRIKSFQTCHGSEYLFPISTMFGSTIESEEIIQKQDTEKNISIWDFLLLLNKILFNSFCISAYRLAFFRIMLTNEIREPGLKNASHFIINNKLKRYKEEMETHFSLFFFFFFLTALSLCCCPPAFSSCGEPGLLFIVVHGLLIAVASLVAEHSL